MLVSFVLVGLIQLQPLGTLDYDRVSACLNHMLFGRHMRLSLLVTVVFTEQRKFKWFARLGLRAIALDTMGNLTT